MVCRIPVVDPSNQRGRPGNLHRAQLPSGLFHLHALLRASTTSSTPMAGPIQLLPPRVSAGLSRFFDVSLLVDDEYPYDHHVETQQPTIQEGLEHHLQVQPQFGTDFDDGKKSRESDVR